MDSSNVSVTNRKKAKQRPISGLWWVSPAGYSIATGYEPGANEYELTFNPMPSGELFRHVDEPDESMFYAEDSAYRPKRSESHALEWIVANRFGAAEIEDSWNPRQFGSHMYEPLRVPGLHRQFAAMPLTAAGALDFASKYGFLGISTLEIWNEEGRSRYGEWVEHWRNAGWIVRRLVELWDLLRDPTTPDAKFEDYLFIDCEGAYLRLPDGDDEPNPDPENIWPWWGAEREAWFPWVPEELMSESRGRTSAREVLRVVVGWFIGETSVPMVTVGGGGQLNMVPKNLLGAIFLSFAQELMGRTETPVRCASCGKWFNPKHAARMYCTDACKMKAYRRSKRTAATV